MPDFRVIPDAMTVPPLDVVALVAAALPRGGRAVLAVSGGLDSMTLLHAAGNAQQERECDLTVATFDHRSGPQTARAVRLVVEAALGRGLPVVVGCAERKMESEAAWRAARWEFLRSVAAQCEATVLTAHTCDDQIETVLMRAMRGAGARGLAALRAPSVVGRPLLSARRQQLSEYAMAHGVRWIEDPTNRSRRFLRNRIRHDLLPALRRVSPSIDDDLLAIGERAATWRVELASAVRGSVAFQVVEDAPFPGLDVSADDLRQQSRAALGIVWPELAARIGVALNARGTRRAVDFTNSERVGARIQLSGGWELFRSRERFELRRSLDREGPVDRGRPLKTPMTWGQWSFSRRAAPTSDPWCAPLPADQPLTIRPWLPGDKLLVRHGQRLIARKVKYFLSDARISGHIRARWPVVLAGDEIVWIPGVRRSDAATVRSGGPVVIYVCDYLDRRS